jgi:hypothetical protein
LKKRKFEFDHFTWTFVDGVVAFLVFVVSVVGGFVVANVVVVLGTDQVVRHGSPKKKNQFAIL